MKTKEQMLEDYIGLWNTCVIKEDKIKEIDSIINKIIINRVRYEHVDKLTGVPWWFIALIHVMESNCNFKTHLHNGDPLTARTVHIPKNRPLTGEPPFSWEESAVDALKLKNYTFLTYDLPNALYRLEAYNGFGYMKMGRNTPYLWSYSNHYEKGKFVADGKFDKDAISKQCGAAVLLKRLVQQDVVKFITENKNKAENKGSVWNKFMTFVQRMAQ